MSFFNLPPPTHSPLQLIIHCSLLDTSRRHDGRVDCGIKIVELVDLLINNTEEMVSLCQREIQVKEFHVFFFLIFVFLL